MEREHLGLVGMGLVGSALAQRLLESGVGVGGCDLDLDNAAVVRTLRWRPHPDHA